MAELGRARGVFNSWLNAGFGVFFFPSVVSVEKKNKSVGETTLWLAFVRSGFENKRVWVGGGGLWRPGSSRAREGALGGRALPGGEEELGQALRRLVPSSLQRREGPGLGSSPPADE